MYVHVPVTDKPPDDTASPLATDAGPAVTPIIGSPTKFQPSVCIVSRTFGVTQIVFVNINHGKHLALLGGRLALPNTLLYGVTSIFPHHISVYFYV